ncbi:STAS domain-containing protein [Kitasatospora sp. NPDC091257]|uniref:STAS domain-containing protein n=1 Tax=unclassified Kitasatospora TaxID=2633591 RepID=UPI002F9125F2
MAIHKHFKNLGSRAERQDDCPDPPPILTPHLRITTTKIPGTAVIVRLDGVADDQEDRRRLNNALSRALQDRPPWLVIDLANQTFCYSVCLNALLAARLGAKAAQVEMMLAAPPPQTMRLLEITGTDAAFTIHPSVHAALGSARYVG